MVSFRERTFLVAGSDFFQRQQAIKGITKRILKDQSSAFNFTILYSKELDSKSLQEKLFTTSFGKNKIILFRNFFDLAPSLRDTLFTKIKKIISANYLIFETDKEYYQLKFSSDNLFKLVIQKSAIFRVSSNKREVTIKDFMNNIDRNDLQSSLYVLESLFQGGGKDRIIAQQIIGILVKKFSISGSKKLLEKEYCKQQKNFRYLWEADRAIKDKGLDARLVVEVLLAKIFAGIEG